MKLPGKCLTTQLLMKIIIIFLLMNPSFNSFKYVDYEKDKSNLPYELKYISALNSFKSNTVSNSSSEKFIPDFNGYYSMFFNIFPGNYVMKREANYFFNNETCDKDHYSGFRSLWVDYNKRLEPKDQNLLNDYEKKDVKFFKSYGLQFRVAYQKAINEIDKIAFDLSQNFYNWKAKIVLIDDFEVLNTKNSTMLIEYNYYLLMQKIKLKYLIKYKINKQVHSFEKCLKKDQNSDLTCYYQASKLFSILDTYTTFFDNFHNNKSDLENCKTIFFDILYQKSLKIKEGYIKRYLLKELGVLKDNDNITYSTRVFQGKMLITRTTADYMDMYDRHMRAKLAAFEENPDETYLDLPYLVYVWAFKVQNLPQMKVIKYIQIYQRCMKEVHLKNVSDFCAPYQFFACETLGKLTLKEYNIMQKYKKMKSQKDEVEITEGNTDASQRYRYRFQEMTANNITNGSNWETTDQRGFTTINNNNNNNNDATKDFKHQIQRNIQYLQKLRKILWNKDTYDFRFNFADSSTSANADPLNKSDSYIDRYDKYPLDHSDFKAFQESSEDDTLGDKEFHYHAVLNLPQRLNHYVASMTPYEKLCYSTTISYLIYDVFANTRDMIYNLRYGYVNLRGLENSELKNDYGLVAYKGLVMFSMLKLLEWFVLNDWIWFLHNYNFYYQYSTNRDFSDSFRKQCSRYNTIEYKLPIELYKNFYSERELLLIGDEVYHTVFAKYKQHLTVSRISSTRKVYRTWIEDYFQFNHWLKAVNWEHVLSQVWYYGYNVRMILKMFNLLSYYVSNISINPQSVTELLDFTQVIVRMNNENLGLSNILVPNSVLFSLNNTFRYYAFNRSVYRDMMEGWYYFSLSLSFLSTALSGNKYFIRMYLQMICTGYYVALTFDWLGLMKYTYKFQEFYNDDGSITYTHKRIYNLLISQFGKNRLPKINSSAVGSKSKSKKSKSVVNLDKLLIEINKKEEIQESNSKNKSKNNKNNKFKQEKEQQEKEQQDRSSVEQMINTLNVTHRFTELDIIDNRLKILKIKNFYDKLQIILKQSMQKKEKDILV